MEPIEKLIQSSAVKKTVVDAKKALSALEALKSGSEIVLLRHANSQFNHEHSQLVEKDHTEEDMRKLRTKRDLRDAPLSPLGIQQWKMARSFANQIKVETVLVSPLRRAMETAYKVFKTHPNFENIHFILLPNMREAIDTSCDIPVNIADTVEKYKTKFKRFDCSKLEKYGDIPHFFLKDIKQDFTARIMSEKIADAEDPFGSNAFDLLLEEIEENYPDKTESISNLLRRIRKVKKFVEKLRQLKVSEEDSKIVLVGHSNYFKYWTGKWDRPTNEDEEVPEPKEYVWLNNCEFYADNVSFPPKNQL